MSFQDLGPREVWMLARFAAVPIGVFVALVAWMLWLHAGQRTLQRRLAALEAEHRGH